MSFERILLIPSSYLKILTGMMYSTDFTNLNSWPEKYLDTDVRSGEPAYRIRISGFSMIVLNFVNTVLSIITDLGFSEIVFYSNSR
jgi:hypothetical protein